MRKRDIIIEKTILILIPFYYWLGYSVLEVLPSLEEIIDVAFTVWDSLFLVLYFVVVVYSESIIRQGVELFDKNDNEED